MNLFDEGRKSIMFPSIYVGGYVGMRYAGIDNGWIDFVVLVPKGCEDADKVIKAMDAFWDEEYECYGDAIEEAFPNDIILFHDSDDESEEYEEKWEEMLSGIDWFWVNR